MRDVRKFSITKMELTQQRDLNKKVVNELDIFSHRK